MKHRVSLSSSQTAQVIIGLFLGVIVGTFLHHYFKGHDGSGLSHWINGFNAITDLFMRLIKMIIAPLVFSTLVVGMAKMGDGNTLGRIAGKAILWFFSASVLSLLMGLVLVNSLTPGESLQLPLPEINADPGIARESLSIQGFISHIVPKSIAEAMTLNEILQIVVFSMFFGVASAQLGDRAKPMIHTLDALSHIMLKMTSYVMRLAPLAVFAALASVISQKGLGILETYGLFLIEFYLGLFCLWGVLCLLGYFLIGQRIKSLLQHIREPMILAFGTASSEAAYPMLLRQLGRFGCSDRITGLVLPLGYSFNLDGSMMYMTFAVLFIAQAYGIHMSLEDQALMMFVLLFTSKGIAGVPRASLVVISATLSMFHIPEAGLLLLLGIDQILDMGRSATNVLGNSIAATAVSRMENELEPRN